MGRAAQAEGGTGIVDRLRAACEEEFPALPLGRFQRDARRAFRRGGGPVDSGEGGGAAAGLPPSVSASSRARRMSASVTGRGK